MSGTATLWDEDGLRIWVQWADSGKLLIQGQQLRGGSEYEYGIAVPAVEVPKLVAALGGLVGDDVIALAEANAATILGPGELAWVKSLGIVPEFWSRTEGDWFANR